MDIQTCSCRSLVRSPAPPLGSHDHRWIASSPTSYSDLVVTSSLYVIGLWKDTRKVCSSHPKTSAVPVGPLRKRRLLSTFFAKAHLLRGTDIDYLALQSLSAWRGYHLLMSRIIIRLLNLRVGFPARDSHVLNVQPFRWPTSSSLVRSSSTETLFTCGVTTSSCACTIELLVSKLAL